MSVVIICVTMSNNNASQFFISPIFRILLIYPIVMSTGILGCDLKLRQIAFIPSIELTSMLSYTCALLINSGYESGIID